MEHTVLYFEKGLSGENKSYETHKKSNAYMIK